MLSSMTGFGCAHFDAPFGRLVAEIQSINRKYLDVSVSMPKEFGQFEYEVRKWVGEKITRGQVAVRLYLLSNASSVERLLPDMEVLKALKNRWEHIAEALGFEAKKIDLPFLMIHSPIQQKLDLFDDRDVTAIEHCVKEALDGLIRMKRKEGIALTLDFKERIQVMEKYLQEIELFLPDAVKRMQKKLVEKMKEAQQSAELEDRIFREVLIYAERIDVSEEIVRLKSYFDQFLEMLHPKENAIGRKMDFLIQEMGREINTLGSKSAEAQISRRVVEMKSELEKMREQVQNIE